jgi:hypothetical protein
MGLGNMDLPILQAFDPWVERARIGFVEWVASYLFVDPA